jgi:preprotein translocase subunit SecD
VVLEDLVLSAPEINATSFHGSGQIVGDLDAQEAQTLAEIINTPG